MSDANAVVPSSVGTAGSNTEVCAGLMAMCLWFGLFVAGTFIGTKNDRQTLAGEASAGEKAQALLVVLFCYTPTNAAMLCCIASVLGGIFRRMRSRQRQRLLCPSLSVLLLSLLFQGFVVYLVMASGILSFGGWDHFFEHPNRDQYLRLAATSSLISLMIGYSPGLFNSLMGRLETWAQQGIAHRGTAPAAHAPRQVAEGAAAAGSAK